MKPMQQFLMAGLLGATVFAAPGRHIQNGKSISFCARATADPGSAGRATRPHLNPTGAGP
jgi:hypothetical protein